MDSSRFFEKGDPNRPAVVCVHGLMGSARNLYRVVQTIADAGFHALAFDQRGHGHSPHGGPYNLDTLAHDVIGFIQARCIARAHLVGHSMGARVCLRAASLAPERVISLTMLDAGVRPSNEGRDDVKKVVFSLADSYESKAEAEKSFAGLDRNMRQFLLSNLRERDGKIRFIFDLPAIRDELLETLKTDQSDLWAELKCPALVVRGDRSEYLPGSEMERMRTIKPNAFTATVANAGHWLHVDNLAETTEAILHFFKTVKD